jgi:membrane associated rhomboid family serine protease
MGSGGFFVTYFAAGIFGFVRRQLVRRKLTHCSSNVLGANFALVGRPSVGASGAIFGTVAVCDFEVEDQLPILLPTQVTWVDLFAHWAYHYRPVRKVLFHRTS